MSPTLQETFQNFIQFFRQKLPLLFFKLSILLQVLIAASAYVYGNPLRLINEYDSFGNVCAFDKNEKLADFNLSGANTKDKPSVLVGILSYTVSFLERTDRFIIFCRYLFTLDFGDAHHSLQICVKKCPDVDLHSMKDIENFFHRTGSLLCR